MVKPFSFEFFHCALFFNLKNSKVPKAFNNKKKKNKKNNLNFYRNFRISTISTCLFNGRSMIKFDQKNECLTVEKNLTITFHETIA